MITFRSFTPELARVVSGFATSPNTFIVKSIAVQPASGASTSDATAGAAPNPYNPYNPYAPGGPMAGDLRYREGMPMPGTLPAPGQQPGSPATGKGGLQTVLKEQLLRITLEVEIVKLLPK
jgi:hypothetical protein